MSAQTAADDRWHRGGWMQTYTGRRFHPLDPDPDDVDIADIARSLSMQCRYNGQVERFYSVGQHCVLVSELVDAEHALWGLLHDAAEAYVGDMVRPLKKDMPDFQAAEDRVLAVIAEKFGLDGTTIPQAVIDADTRILLDERAAILAPPAGDWGISGEPFGIDIGVWNPRDAEDAYLDRFHKLTA